MKLCEFVKRKNFWFVLEGCASTCFHVLVRTWSWGAKLTEMVSWETLNTFQGHAPSFAKFTCWQQNNITVSHCPFSLQKWTLLCFPLLLGKRHEFSQAPFLLLGWPATSSLYYPHSKTFWRPPETPPEAFCWSITGNMQRIGSQVSVKPNKCRWRKKTWDAGPAGEEELTNQY